jgi:hypothetical protein
MSASHWKTFLAPVFSMVRKSMVNGKLLKQNCAAPSLNTVSKNLQYIEVKCVYPNSR